MDKIAAVTFNAFENRSEKETFCSRASASLGRRRNIESISVYDTKVGHYRFILKLICLCFGLDHFE